MEATMERLAYSVREAAEALGVSSRTIVREIRRGHLRAVRVSRRVVIPADALAQFLQGNVPAPALEARAQDRAAVVVRP